MSAMDNPYICESCNGKQCNNPEAKRLGMCWKENYRMGVRNLNQKVIKGILVSFNDSLTDVEVNNCVDLEIAEWRKNSKPIDTITLTIEGDGIIIETHEKSPIRRIRRITGYLSEVSNFNDSKRQELSDRRTQEDGHDWNYPSDRERFRQKNL
ncbi:MAG: hypothetical protein H6Q67_1723 [Firmicutes bacterium]|nr:hypothetical protein [Bacillota bacterium]